MDNDTLRWDEHGRAALYRALRMIQANASQRQKLHLTGEEAVAIADAAQCWSNMLDHLDSAVRAGTLKLPEDTPNA